MARKPETEKYNYVLDWIREATDARRAQNAYVERSVKAYQGEPSANYYKNNVNAYADSISKVDSIKGKLIKDTLNDIPDKKNMTYHNAVETVVSMAQGGVGRFEFGPYDPDMDQDDKVVDMLASAAKHFYSTEKVDSVMPQYIRASVLSGASYFHLKSKKGEKVLTMLDSSQVLTDPKRSKTNKQRFIGFVQREGFAAIKSRTTKTQGGYMLKSLNDAQIYLSQVVQELNGVLQSDSTATFLHEELRRDLDTFYKPIITRIADVRKTDPQYMYGGDEVEIAYVYDLMNDMYFEVVNRRYIIIGKPNELKRKVKCRFTDHKGKEHTATKEIKLDHPIVELPYLKNFWDTYPISPLFYVLDDFDSLCAMESVLYHNLSIMAPLTFIGQSSDAEKVSKVASIAGEIVEGLPQTFAVLDKTHDVTPVLAAITRYEERIKRIIGATDPFEMQAMLGDRASAKEVTALSGQISQRLNPFVANIETAMATLGEKFMKLELIFGDHNKPYSFVHNGKYAELDAESMAGDYEVTAKLTSSIKLEQESNSRKALELIQYMGQSEEIDKKEFFATMLPIVLVNLVNREQAVKMVAEKYRPMPEETIAEIRRREEERAKMDPIDKIDLSQFSPEELDQMIAEVSATTADPNAYFDGGGTAQPGAEAQFDAQGNPILPPTDASAIPPEEDPSIVASAAQQPVSADPTAMGTVTIPTGIPAGAEAAGEVANDPTRTA